MKNVFVRKLFAAGMFLLWSSVAPASAQQTNVKLNFSGSMVPTSIAVKADSVTDQEILAGGGTLGSFTLHKLRTDAAAPQ